MPSFTFHSLSLGSGRLLLRRFEPVPGLLTPLAGLRADGAIERLAAPMGGYGLALDPGSDADGGVFRVFLTRPGPPRPHSVCFYCASDPAAERRFDQAVEEARRAAMDGRTPGIPFLLRRPRQTPWLAVISLGIEGPPETPLLQDAVFMTLAAGPRPAAGNSRGLPKPL